jgi:hypothetical protein
MDIKNLMNCIYDPSNCILSDLYQQSKELNMQNLVMTNALKFLITVQFMKFTSDLAFTYNVDKIHKARDNIESNVKKVITQQFINYSITTGSRLPRESRALMTELITNADIKEASKYFDLDSTSQ